MTITRLTETEFRIECEGDEEAKKAESLKQFDHEGATYFVRKIIPGIESTYRSYFVIVK